MPPIWTLVFPSGNGQGLEAASFCTVMEFMVYLGSHFLSCSVQSETTSVKVLGSDLPGDSQGPPYLGGIITMASREVSDRHELRKLAALTVRMGMWKMQAVVIRKGGEKSLLGNKAM